MLKLDESKTEQKLRKEIAELGKQLYDRGLVYATAGNISARCGDCMLITPTGAMLGELTADMIVETDMDGNPTGRRKPSSEYRAHLEIYRRIPQHNAVIHTHPPASTAFACLKKSIPTALLSEAALMLGNIGCAEYAKPGSDELARNILGFAYGNNVCLAESHGLFAWGANLRQAFYYTELAEFTAKVCINVNALGY